VIPPRIPASLSFQTGVGRLVMYTGQSDATREFVSLVNNGSSATLRSTSGFRAEMLSVSPFGIETGEVLRDVSLLFRQRILSGNQFALFTIDVQFPNYSAPPPLESAAQISVGNLYCFLVMPDPEVRPGGDPTSQGQRWTLRLDRFGVFVAGGADGGVDPAAQLSSGGSDSVSRAFIGGANGDASSGGSGFCGTLSSSSQNNFSLSFALAAGALGVFYWRRRLLKRSVRRS
jgi:hypothetical protein